MLEIFTIAFFSALAYSIAALVMMADTMPQSLTIPSAIGDETLARWRHSLEDRRLASALQAHIPQGFEQKSLADLAFEIGHRVDDESAFEALAPIQLLGMVGNLAQVWDRYRGVRLSIALRKDQPWRQAVYAIYQDGLGVDTWRQFRNRELRFYSI